MNTNNVQIDPNFGRLHCSSLDKLENSQNKTIVRWIGNHDTNSDPNKAKRHLGGEHEPLLIFADAQPL
ncbi:MAG: hypothetical protein D6706_17330 [Chloroflexi bacterium]|nr:MAG: hypothetical protein D6706_17330 [Chloroflexota bacterium]